MSGTSRRLSAWFAAVATLLVTAHQARALDPQRTLSQYVSHRWRQSDDGLPANYVPSMVQTRDGYLWLATQEGLVRFDGARFTVFSKSNVSAFTSNDVKALVEDADGALWVGTRGGGVVRYANGVFTGFTSKDGLTNDVVLTLAASKDGAMWIGTRGGGVSALKGGHFTTYRVADGLANGAVWAIAQLPDGAMVFGTDGGASILRDGHFTTVSGLSDPRVKSLMVDPDGTLWIGSVGGVDRVRGGEVMSLREAEGVGGDVFAFQRDRDDNLWIASESDVYRLSTKPDAPGVKTPLGALSSLGHEGSRSLVQDREGNLWVGTGSDGLLRLQDGKVTTFGSRFVSATYEAPDGTMWLGLEDGLFEQRGDEMVAVRGAPPAMVVYSLAPSHDGMWVGTRSQGIFHLDGGKLTRWEADPTLATRSVDIVYEDASRAVWVGTPEGVERIDGTTTRRFGPKDGIAESEVDSIEPAPDGSLWMGGRAGVFHWKGGTFTRVASDDVLGNAPIETLRVDGEDLWIGTAGSGLGLLRGGTLYAVTARQGLFNDTVYAVVDDARGNLWMTSNRGIFRASKASLVEVATGRSARVESFVLTTSDGMKSSECNDGQPAGIRARNGDLWFPTTEGAVRVDPGHMRMNTVVPPVRVEEMFVDRAPIDVAAPKHGLAAGSQDFQFSYTALSFTAPERVHFKYQLEGFDKDWVDAGTRRVAYYTNLSPGAYRFRVKAANDDGVWNEEGAQLSFTLAPRFHQTIPFYLLCAFGLMFLGAGSVRWRLLALRARATDLERKVDERTSELAKANTDLAGAFRALAEKDGRLHEDLLEAQAFQQRILPKLPSGGAVRFRALYRPADLVGGDIYDICHLGDRHYRVFVADTTGHGVQASLRTMVLKTEYDRVKLAPEGPAHVLVELNRKIVAVYPDLELRCSGCCFDVIADAEGGARILYANAAHPPLLRISRGRVDELYARGTFLGVVLDAPFHQIEATLAPGDRLLAYTDGLYEQEDANGRAFGMERMTALLADFALDAEGIVQLLDTEVTSFSAGRPLADDMLLVCLECAGDRRSKLDLDL
jgi:ligand-binding sensor domain-containing protein/serine phosphatase RsbU (regulator of sigma subunit)